MIVNVLGRARRALVAAGVLAAVFGAVEASAQTVKLGYVEFPPYSHTDGGVAKGRLIEHFEKAAKTQGITYTAESAPARRLLPGIAEGEFHVFLGVKGAKEFEGTTLVSAEPIDTVELNVYAMGEAPAVKAKEDLAGKAVILLAGYSYGGWRSWIEDPANKVQIVEARTADQALQLLQAGRAPLLLQYALPMEQALGGKAIPELKSTPVQVVSAYIVVSKKAPDAEALLGKLESGFKATK